MMGPEEARKLQKKNKDGFTEYSGIIGVPLSSED